MRLDVLGEEIRFRWGEQFELGTAAYWVQQTRERRPASDHQLGGTLAEELVACILGGYGLPAEMGIAAFEALRAEDLIRLHPPPDEGDLEEVLRQPLHMRGRSGPVRYRFPAQRAARVVGALRFLCDRRPPAQAHELREWLLQVPGVGPKTASWVARNRSSDDGIAIVDVHIRQAGIAAGFFPSDWKLPRDYARFEQAFCAVAEIGGVSSAALDARIWRDLAYLGTAKPLMIGRSAVSTGSLY